FIFVAKVEQLLPEKPALVLSVKDDLKGKAEYRRLPVVVMVDRRAEHENYIPQIMKRLAAGQDLILFAKENGKRTIVFGFSNGSWFHIAGQRVDKDRVAWSLVSGEPLLRQTFSGTTEELRQLVADCLAGKRKSPDVNEMVKPGFGPEAKT